MMSDKNQESEKQNTVIDKDGKEIKHLIKSRLDEAGIHHATLEFECIGVSCETENNCC